MATDEMIDDFLEHFGVKGMKWGIRKDRGSGPSSASSTTRSPATVLKNAIAKKPTSESSADFARAKQIAQKRPNQMSNEELRHLTTRMQLERQYKQLNPSVVKRGYGVATGIVAVGGTAVGLYKLANHDMTKRMKDAFGSALKNAKKP